MELKMSGHNDIWEKWAWLWNALFYATVLLSFGLMLRDNQRSTPAWLAGVLTVVWLLWHWAGIKLAYSDISAWEERSVARLIIILGDIVLWFVLINISIGYYLALFGLFGQIFRHLQLRYAVPAAILLTAATIFEQLSGAGETFTLTSPTVWVFFFMGLGTIMLGIWVWAIIAQSTQRRQLIEALEAAQQKLAASERREGVLEERQRLAREIHDTLAQGFTSIVMHLEAADQAWPGDPDRFQKHLDLARETARNSLDQARRVVQDLRPELLDQHPLSDAIERMAAHWRDETGIQVKTVTTGNLVPIHPNIEVTLLRAAQESLANIRKHARATAVQLTLSYMDDVVILDVQDNGVGIRGANSSFLSGGFGLQAMRERVAQCGGRVIIESDPDEGTTIGITIPLNEIEL